MTIPSDRTIRVLLSLVGVLTAASVLAHISKHGLGRESAFGLVPLFDSTREGNIPTWLSSLGLLACSTLVAGLAKSKRAAMSSAWRPLAVLAAVLFLAAADEATQVHETVGLQLGVAGGFDGPLRYAWVIPGGALLALIAAYLGPWVPRLPPGVRTPVMAGTALFLAAALGLEVVEAIIATDAGRSGTAAEERVAVAEEAMEMSGIALALAAVLRFYALNGIEIRLSLSASPDTHRTPTRCS